MKQAHKRTYKRPVIYDLDITSYISKSACKYFLQIFLPSWEQSLRWHHINTVQSSCHSLGLQKRLISQNVWQEENMLSSCTPTSPFLWWSSVMQILRAWDWYLRRGDNVLFGLSESQKKKKLFRNRVHLLFLSAGIPVVFCGRGCFTWLSTDS